MAELTIIAGECGRGSGEYDTGLFILPDGSKRGAETVAAVVLHGGVTEKQGKAGQIVGGLKGGLALAAQLDLSTSLSLAATAVGAGLSVLDGGPRQKAVLEVRFTDGASFVAMADVGVAALMENDRRVIQLAAPRLANHPIPPTPEEPGISARAIEAASDAVESAGSAVSSAFSFIKSKTLG
ncbi:hypothetical protein LRS73_05345 [Methylobacterium currus]|uniref:hypothetical protein n=1 Tax=Methylobacterium currus TaxID=2051553 RepID=UPI001E466FBB|nr:hypothetical protein [Methylobacterium currus]UHC17320.1 hypothetical protein LRS73_05345 [Methylobacterium currus]